MKSANFISLLAIYAMSIKSEPCTHLNSLGFQIDQPEKNIRWGSISLNVKNSAILTRKRADKLLSRKDSCKLVWDSDDADNVGDQNLIRGCNVTKGWHIIPDSVSCRILFTKGSPVNGGNASTATFAGWHFRTYHHIIGVSDKIIVELNYIEYKNDTLPKDMAFPAKH